MRPPKVTQRGLRYPLNEFLGTEANVRLLRVLARHPTPFTSGELARRAMLGRTSVYPALRVLERAGIVEHIGVGSQKLVQLRMRHPLSQRLTELFRAEAQRVDDLTGTLRRLASARDPRVLSAWIDEAPNAESDVLTLYVVARPEDLDALVDQVNADVADVGRTYDVHIAVHGLTRSEIGSVLSPPRLEEHAPRLVGGVPPAALLERPKPASRRRLLTSHPEHDARSRRLALAVAAKLEADPGLAAMAAGRVKRRAKEASAAERKELAEWARLLSTLSTAQLRKFLVEDSERATRLRQSLPALQILAPTEREAVLASESDAEVLAAIGRRP